MRTCADRYGVTHEFMPMVYSRQRYWSLCCPFTAEYKALDNKQEVVTCIACIARQK